MKKLITNIKVLNNLPIDAKYFNGNVPYTSKDEVYTNIPKHYRHIGLKVNINNEEYWFKSGVEDTDLVKVELGGSGSSSDTNTDEDNRSIIYANIDRIGNSKSTLLIKMDYGNKFIDRIKNIKIYNGINGNLIDEKDENTSGTYAEASLFYYFKEFSYILNSYVLKLEFTTVNNKKYIKYIKPTICTSIVLVSTTNARTLEDLQVETTFDHDVNREMHKGIIDTHKHRITNPPTINPNKYYGIAFRVSNEVIPILEVDSIKYDLYQLFTSKPETPTYKPFHFNYKSMISSLIRYDQGLTYYFFEKGAFPNSNNIYLYV